MIRSHSIFPTWSILGANKSVNTRIQGLASTWTCSHAATKQANTKSGSRYVMNWSWIAVNPTKCSAARITRIPSACFVFSGRHTTRLSKMSCANTGLMRHSSAVKMFRSILKTSSLLNILSPQLVTTSFSMGTWSSSICNSIQTDERVPICTCTPWPRSTNTWQRPLAACLSSRSTRIERGQSCVCSTRLFGALTLQIAQAAQV